VAGSDDHVVEEARRSHASVIADGGERRDERVFRYAAEPSRPFDRELPAPPAAARELDFAGGQLATVRRFLSEWAAEKELGGEQADELVLAVNELATNSIRYGGGTGRLLAWCDGDGALVCEIRDSGHIEDPLIGRSRPAPNQHTGRGLWLVHQLCDAVEIHSSPAGTAVRVHKRRIATD